MIITPEQQQKMLEAAKPLIEWMKANCHPHCTALVDQVSVMLVEGIATAHSVQGVKLSKGESGAQS